MGFRHMAFLSALPGDWWPDVLKLFLANLFSLVVGWLLLRVTQRFSQSTFDQQRSEDKRIREDDRVREDRDRAQAESTQARQRQEEALARLIGQSIRTTTPLFEMVSESLETRRWVKVWPFLDGLCQLVESAYLVGPLPGWDDKRQKGLGKAIESITYGIRSKVLDQPLSGEQLAEATNEIQDVLRLVRGGLGSVLEAIQTGHGVPHLAWASESDPYLFLASQVRAHRSKQINGPS